MNKIEAAAALGVSVRAVERYAAVGKLPARYVRGKTGQVLDFEAGAIERFKADLEAPVVKGATGADEARREPQQGSAAEERQNPTTALARLAEPQRVKKELSEEIRALMEMVRQAPTSGRRALSVPVEAKPLLTLAECCALTGLSRTTLKRAIDEKRLAARVLGRAQRVRRDELDEWLKTL